MGQDNAGKTPAQDQPMLDPLQGDQGPQEPNPLTSTPLPAPVDQSMADDLLHAAYVPPPEMVASVELTLDHLSETVDLFDVPPFDYGDTGQA